MVMVPEDIVKLIMVHNITVFTIISYMHRRFWGGHFWLKCDGMGHRNILSELTPFEADMT